MCGGLWESMWQRVGGGRDHVKEGSKCRKEVKGLQEYINQSQNLVGNKP